MIFPDGKIMCLRDVFCYKLAYTESHRTIRFWECTYFRHSEKPL